MSKRIFWDCKTKYLFRFYLLIRTNSMIGVYDVCRIIKSGSQVKPLCLALDFCRKDLWYNLSYVSSDIVSLLFFVS